MTLLTPWKVFTSLTLVVTGLAATNSSAQFFNLPALDLVMMFGQRAACEAKFPELRPLFAEAFESFVKLNEDQMSAASLRKLEKSSDTALSPLFDNVSRELCTEATRALATFSLRESARKQQEFNAERRKSEMIAAQLERGGRYRNSIGVTLASDCPAVIAEVMVDSPAAVAGLRIGDEVVDFNGSAIECTSDLILSVLVSSSDRPLPLKVIRNGERLTLRIKVARVERPNED